MRGTLWYCTVYSIAEQNVLTILVLADPSNFSSSSICFIPGNSNSMQNYFPKIITQPLLYAKTEVCTHVWTSSQINKQIRMLIPSHPSIPNVSLISPSWSGKISFERTIKTYIYNICTCMGGGSKKLLRNQKSSRNGENAGGRRNNLVRGRISWL